MKNIWFISDTHFGHARILTFKDKLGNLIRPGFQNVTEMDELIIEKWNSVVKSDDIIYHLGDITFSEKIYNQVMPRLNGQKKLILGNHDNLGMSLYSKYFEEISSWHKWKSKGAIPNFVLCHYPLHRGSFDYRLGEKSFCVHGHLHQNLIDEPGYINVCVEHTNYTPINLDELLVKMKG